VVLKDLSGKGQHAVRASQLLAGIRNILGSGGERPRREGTQEPGGA
jgi:hypothetical protein